MEEIWRPIKNFEDSHLISNFGRVRSLDRKVKYRHGKRLIKGRILKNRLALNKYVIINLNQNGFKNTKLVHRLVAEAFIEIRIICQKLIIKME